MPAVYQPTTITTPPGYLPPALQNMNPDQWLYLGKLDSNWDAAQSLRHAADCTRCLSDLTALGPHARPRGRHVRVALH